MVMPSTQLTFPSCQQPFDRAQEPVADLATLFDLGQVSDDSCDGASLGSPDRTQPAQEFVVRNVLQIP